MMKRLLRRGFWAALALVVVLTAVPSPLLHGQDKDKGKDKEQQKERTPADRREFMRQKLEFSKLILEGLTTENYESINKNAKALRRLSQASEWEVPTIPNATDYVTFTAEFQRLCDELATKSKEKNIDGATLAYLRITMSCVNCHKYVRFASH
jgi:hypothetical protein